MNTALELHDLCKNYPGFSLDHLTLSLPSGSILGLVGENGAGKSTTMKLVLGQIQRDGGSVRLLGQENPEQSPALRAQLGVVLDEVGLPSYLNPKQIGRIMGGIYPNWQPERYRQLCQRFGLPDGKRFGSFSRGMKMKMGLAVALSHDAKLLLLDEATSGLDPVVRDELLDLFMDFTQDEGHSILLSSHIVSDLEKVCDYVAFLHQGKLLLCEEKDRLTEDYALLPCSLEELKDLPSEALRGWRRNSYGAQALVLREPLAASWQSRLSPVTLEELFVLLVKHETEGC